MKFKYLQEQNSTSPVTCPVHNHGTHIYTHVLRVENFNAVYARETSGNFTNVVFVPFAGHQDSCQNIFFTCFNSCAGLKKSPIVVEFSLETSSHVLIAQKSIGVKICASPGRDRIKEEEGARARNDVYMMEAKGGDGGRRRLTDLIKYLMSIPSIKDAIQCKSGNVIKARFAADGRRTSAKIGSVMAVMNLLDEGCNTVNNQYTVTLYNGKEDYTELKECLWETFREMEDCQTNGIVIDGVKFHVEWICCCDWKFLAIVYGLNPACSKFFCIWCFCTKHDISDLSIEDWPIVRTLEDCMVACKKKSASERKGSMREPLISIPFDSVVVDTLHLFLRIMGLLFRLVIEKIIIAKQKERLTAAMEAIRTSFKFFEVRIDGSSESQTKWTTLDGKDLQNVLTKLEVKQVLEGINGSHGTDVNDLWNQ